MNWPKKGGDKDSRDKTKDSLVTALGRVDVVQDTLIR